MKREQEPKENIKAQRPRRASAAPSMSSKTIRNDSGDVLRQYPARVGYHGDGDETKLNPEE